MTCCLFFNELGTGYATMQALSTTMLGIKVMYLKTFQSREANISGLRCDDACEMTDEAAQIVCDLYEH